MCSVEPVDCRLATGGVLAPLGPVFAPAEPSPRVVTPSVALARAHLGYDMAVRGMEAARVMAERPSSNLAAGCICQLHFVKRFACRACAQIRFHLIQAEVHKPESQSVAVMYWQGVPFGGASVLRQAPALLALAVRTVCCRLGAGSHVDGHVFVEVVHRAAADLDVGAAPLHDASTHCLCELSDDEIQRKHRITLNQQHSLTFSLAHHLIHGSRV